MKLKLLLSLLLLCGCTQSNYSDVSKPAVSINDYFSANVTNYHYKVINSTFDCLNGTCPMPEVSVRGITVGCTFCATNNTGIVGDQFRVRFGRGGWADMSGGCVLSVDTYEIDDTFDILVSNSTDLIALVTRTGHVKSSGSCEEIYEYNYENIEEWYFTK